MDKVDRFVKIFKEEGGMTTGSTAGKPGFSNAADAEGPTAGRDELLFGKIVRRRKNKQPKNCGCGQNPCITYGKKKHNCASKVKHEEFGIGNPVKGMHDLDESGKVAHYDVFFEHGIEKNVPVSSLEILVTEMHEHVIHEGKKKFTPHKMIDKKNGKEYWADTYEKHLKYDKMGYVHEEKNIKSPWITYLTRGKKGRKK